MRNVHVDLFRSQLNIGRFSWYFPWSVAWFGFYRPFVPERGCDEWHNRSWSISVPLLGAFCWFVTWNGRKGPEHLSGASACLPSGRGVLPEGNAYVAEYEIELHGYVDPDCDICDEMMDVIRGL